MDVREVLLLLLPLLVLLLLLLLWWSAPPVLPRLHLETRVGSRDSRMESNWTASGLMGNPHT